MNQVELNTVGQIFIENRSIEVAHKLGVVLHEDLEERAKQIPGPIVHYIHNLALFDVLLKLNCLFQNVDHSYEACEEYLEHAESLKIQFLNIVDSLKDFEPKDKSSTPTE